MKLTKPCKVFTERLTRTGYGIYPDGRLAHRVAWCDAYGAPYRWIGSLTVRHHCDVRACIEPTHLELGTHEMNMADMRLRGRSNRGERHGAARLTRDHVAWIKAFHVPRSKRMGPAVLARLFGVSAGHIKRILAGQRWQEGTDSLSH